MKKETANAEETAQAGKSEANGSVESTAGVLNPLFLVSVLPRILLRIRSIVRP
jgi:hypothetical protein